MKRSRLLLPMFLLSALGAHSASAALLDVPLPDGSYISNFAGSGLDVAWAGPCAINSPSCGVADLSFQSAYGWRLASAAEAAYLDANLSALDFVFAGANVPLGGSSPDGVNFQYGAPTGDAACASPYFSSSYYHCDWGNAPGSGGADPQPWSYGLAGEVGYAEGILVRNAIGVPEPATLALLGAGLLGFGFSRRRKS